MRELYTSVTYPDLVYQALQAEPEAVAFEWDGGSMSYREAAQAISSMAQTLQAAGLGRGDGLTLLATNRPETFIIQMAALAIGCRYTPLHPLGSADDHAKVISFAEVSAVVYEAEVFGPRIVEMQAAGTLPRLVFSIGSGEVGTELVVDAAPAARPDVDLDERDLAYLPFTGGTTGTPKGVMLPHRVMVTSALLTLAGWDIPERPRYLACTPISHAAGVIVLPILLSGGTVILQRSFTPEGFAAGVKKHNATMAFLVPTMIYAILGAEGVNDKDLASLETVVYGASAIAPARLQEAIDRFGPIFMQLYGQTEAPNTVTALRRRDHIGASLDQLTSCGRALPGVDVRLLEDGGVEVPVGEVGEICIRGRLVMDGYWKNPELTAETLRDGWLHTGDLARRDERGFITIVDRKKDMVVTGGFNVYPREVEDALATHPAVGQVAVIGVPHDKWGEAVAAFVVLRAGATADEDELIAWVKERKGSVQAPKTVEFVDSLPLTPLGKPDKKVLRQRFWGDGRQVH